MADEKLIRLLRDAPADGLGTENLCLDAADRIETLTARLAKVVEALQNIAEGGAYTDMQIARAALAEIGGEG